MPRAGVPLGMAPSPPPKSEKLILQAELRRAWGVADCLIGVVATCLGLVDSLRGRLAQKTRENDDLKKEIVKLKRMLSVHESWNHSSREAVLFAKKRKEFQRRAGAGTGGDGGEEDGQYPSRGGPAPGPAVPVLTENGADTSPGQRASPTATSRLKPRHIGQTCAKTAAARTRSPKGCIGRLYLI